MLSCVLYAVRLGGEDVAQSLLKDEKYKPHPELPGRRWNVHFCLCLGEMLEKGSTLCSEECQFCVMKYPCFFFFFNVLNSLKLECEKLASEKTEMQRHYVMVSKLHNKFKMSISLVC